MHKALRHIYTISPVHSFVDSLAQGVLERFGEKPEYLPNITILLPNLRSCRWLKEAFLRQTDGSPLLLPQIHPLGQVDDEALMLSGKEEWASEFTKILPAISSVERRLLLTQAILQWGSVNPHVSVSYAQAGYLAFELSQFLDEVRREQITFDKLADIVPEELASHWQITLEFFQILSKVWPQLLINLKMTDSVDRSNQLLELQAKLWHKTPPEHPVIVAGTTASIPATRTLIQALTTSDNGYLILPGLDKIADDSSWEYLDENHPQYGLKQLLDKLNYARCDVENWTKATLHNKNNERLKLVSETMRPAQSAEGWQGINLNSSCLEGISYIEAEHTQQEAKIIALILRQQLETAGKTAALITQDRLLARTVRIEMQRWNIELDDSAGKELTETNTAVLLTLILQVLSENYAPVAFLSLIKHPYVSAGMDKKNFQQCARRFERIVLRGPQRQRGIESLHNLLSDAVDAKAGGYTQDEYNELEHWLSAIEKCLNIFAEPFHNSDNVESSKNMLQLLQAHISCAESLCQSTQEGDNINRLYGNDEGRQVAKFIEELLGITAETSFSVPSLKEYNETFTMLWLGKIYRPAWGQHPRLAVLTPMEARLQGYDLVVLGGMNSGSWPKDTNTPWMSRTMRAEFGLPGVQRKTGLAAHDFATLLCAPQVILTRSCKTGGAPAVASSWLLRMETVLKSAGITKYLNNGDNWKKWADLLDLPDCPFPQTSQEPYPTPPAEARPKTLSVTRIEQLMRDPYGIYARHILKLKPLDDVEEELGAADFGTLLHSILEQFINEYNQVESCTPQQQRQALLLIGKAYFDTAQIELSIAPLWWSSFERISRWFIDNEIMHRKNNTITSILTEREGQWRFAMDDGSSFTLTGTADRLEHCAHNEIRIVDYKTGSAPSKTHVNQGYSPQLSLEAVLLQEGGFKDIPLNSLSVSGLEYWQLREKTSGKVITPASSDKKENIKMLTDFAQEGVQRLLNHFAKSTTPYLVSPNTNVAPKYNDYRHLSRIDEWGSVDSEEIE